MEESIQIIELNDEINKENLEIFFKKVNTYLENNNFKQLRFKNYGENLYIYNLGFIDSDKIEGLSLYNFESCKDELYLNVKGDGFHLIMNLDRVKNEK